LYINIGILKGANNHPQEADENFKKAIAYSPNTFDSYAYYARYLQQVKRFNQARQMAEKALELNPYSVLALNVLMDVYNELGLWDNLQRTAKKTLAILPNDTTAKSFLETAKNHINN
jgi:tetratricopeptide (TPR) repeat protein